MTWTDQFGSFPSPTGGLISSFSSYGLSPDLTLKPDIGAPGGNIYSTYPLELGGYATLGGTSMSSPHVAGAARCCCRPSRRRRRRRVRGILQNSADPKVWWGNPGLGFLDNVHRQGAGMVEIDNAILATTTIKPAKISAGEGQAGPYVQDATLRTTAAAPVTYDLSYVNALSTGGVIAPIFWHSNASVAFSAAERHGARQAARSVDRDDHARDRPGQRPVRRLHRVHPAGRRPGLPGAVRRLRRRLPGDPGAGPRPRMDSRGWLSASADRSTDQWKVPRTGCTRWSGRTFRTS